MLMQSVILIIFSIAFSAVHIDLKPEVSLLFIQFSLSFSFKIYIKLTLVLLMRLEINFKYITSDCWLL